MSAETMKRDRVFLRFEDADYYYRSTAVEALQRKVNAAVQAKDELAAVRAYEELGALLSAGRDVTWRRRFFNDCLRPMVDVFISEKARGYLHDLLGRLAFDIGMVDYIGYFERAVEFGNDSVFGSEEVLRAHPEIIIRWIKCHLQKSARDSKVEGREALLDRIVATRDDASNYYLELADVLKDRYRWAADKYYRKCIRLGCEHVAGREEFLREDYEADYIEWFRSLITSGVKPAEAAERCFSRLWKVCTGSESHREYANRLRKMGECPDAVAEFVRCAERGFDWAEEWLHSNSADASVLDGLSETLVGVWLKDSGQSYNRRITLGRCFERNPDKWRKFGNEPIFHACIAGSRLVDGDVLGAVSACVDMDAAMFGESRDFMNQTALDGFPDLRKSIHDALRESPGVLVENELKTFESASPDVDGLNLMSVTIPMEDQRCLGEYAKSGSMLVDPFRSECQQPLCARILLLEAMAKQFSADSVSEMNTSTLKFLNDRFRKLANDEIHDSVRHGNLPSICLWILRRLSVNAELDERKRGEAVLFRIVGNWKPGNYDFPIKLLAAYWNSAGRNLERMLALRLFLDDDNELCKWLEASGEKALFRLVCESVSAPAVA